MSTTRLASRLLSSPRQAGFVELTALDLAAKQLIVTQYVEYSGMLSASALEAGLAKAVLQYPAVLGWIDDSAAAGDGRVLLCWDSHDHSRPGFDLSFQVSSISNPPSIYSNWELWRAQAVPRIEGRMAAAKVTTYPAANKSILVFSFDHALFDYGASYRFLQLWLQQAAAAAATATASNCTLAANGVSSAAATAEVVLQTAKSACTADTAVEVLPAEAQAAACSGQPEAAAAGQTDDTTAASSGDPATVQGLWYHSEGMFSRNCYFDRPWWTLPKSRHDCMDWIQQHKGARCPFAWNPLDPADSCMQGLKGILYGSDSQFSVWRIPCELLKRLKEAAEVAHPLPAGMWYSASTAAAAILVTTLYEAAPETARRLGGLHATTVVDLRGGRCGLDIPSDSMTNASVSGIRVWVPTRMLDDAVASIHAVPPSAAAGEAAEPLGLCKLMHHLRTDLQRQLQDPTGVINKQFEWFEAARRAGASHQVALCQGLLQFDAGDIVLDWLPPAAQLPTLPGTQLITSSVRMLSSYLDRIVMAMPVPRADGEPGYDMQFEVSFPRSRMPTVHQTWTGLGLRAVSAPAQQGQYWGALDGLVYPHSIWLMVKNTVGCLPWLLLKLGKKLRLGVFEQ